jgi:uncharacterized phiE125 gp8 family phage protein
MWYPATITGPVTEPVTAAEVKAQANVDFADDDVLVTRLIAVARNHAEMYCSTRIPSQTAVMKCDSFADMARLSEAPVQSVTSITYMDVDGATQTIADTVYELRADGLEASIVLKPERAWPAIQPRSRVTLTAVVGYADVPPAIKHAMLLFIAGGYAERENSKDEGWTVFDSLLCNYRRGV